MAGGVSRKVVLLGPGTSRRRFGKKHTVGIAKMAEEQERVSKEYQTLVQGGAGFPHCILRADCGTQDSVLEVDA